MGEGGLLAELTRRTPGGRDDVLLGPGDDAALVVPPSGAAMVITQDVVVEDVDFRRAWTTPHAVGWKALVLSLSDLAGMGARPLWFVASVCAPPSTCVDDLLAIHLGLLDAGDAPGCRLVGGDLSATAGPLVVDVCAVGAVGPGAALRRDAGRPGDLLVVTGTLGRAAAGLRVVGDDPAQVPGGGDEDTWRGAQLRPVARLDEGLALVVAGVRCGGDVSDGLLVDAGRTAAASGCAAELWVDHLPVDAPLRARFGEDWLELAVGGGEDFELLAAVDPARVDGLLEEWPDALAPLSVVGRLTEGSGVRLNAGVAGGPVALPPVRSRHFAP